MCVRSRCTGELNERKRWRANRGALGVRVEVDPDMIFLVERQALRDTLREGEGGGQQ